MNYQKNRLIIICLILPFFIVTNKSFAKSTQTQNRQGTVPTRTPTPLPPTATSPNNGGNNPTATFTPEVTIDATATAPAPAVTFAPTPVGGFLPTAVPGSNNPTIQTLGPTNVRNGPSTDHEIIGELVYLEVRFIVGRTEASDWWLIQFNDGQLGWVSSQVVLVQGSTINVPIVDPTSLDGGTPTPIPAETEADPPTPTNTAILTETPLAPDPAPTEVRPTATPIVQATAVPINPPATAVPLQPTDEPSSNSGIILLGVGVLVALGMAAFFMRKRE